MVAKTKKTAAGRTRTPAANNAKDEAVATVLVLRTCYGKDLRSHDGFQWPASGPVECPDWSPEPVCGQGLHGLLWGEGDGSFLHWDADARWLVVRVESSCVVPLGRKVKFGPRAEVVFSGDRMGATDYLVANGAAGRAVDRSTLTGGDRSTLTGGDRSTLTGGDRSTLIIHWWDGTRRRISIGCVGEEGIKAGVAYIVRDGRLARKEL